MFYLQETDIVGLVVRKLLLNYITRPQFPSNIASYAIFSEGNQPGVLQRVGSAAGMVIVISHTWCFCSTSLSAFV